MGLPQAVKRFTLHEYYQLERNAAYKSDFYAGEIWAMAGGSIRHSLISSNISGELRQRLKGGPCRAYESNLRLRNQVTNLVTYPDVAVYCGPLQSDPEDPSHQTVTNPTVVFEVLSGSTEGYDRGLKAENYRLINSLQAYVLVSQDTAHVEIYERQSSGNWLLREERDRDAVLTIPSLAVDLPLVEIYDGVDFSAPDADPRAPAPE